jgi:hypothetical protein
MRDLFRTSLRSGQIRWHLIGLLRRALRRLDEEVR